MLKFEWNALQPGDKMLVHEPRSADLALTPGVVAHVEVNKGGNAVGIRVGAGPTQTILWPSLLAVHHDPPEPDQPCWRCEERAQANSSIPRDDSRQVVAS
jgi:hypothetical protein